MTTAMPFAEAARRQVTAALICLAVLPVALTGCGGSSSRRPAAASARPPARPLTSSPATTAATPATTAQPAASPSTAASTAAPAPSRPAASFSRPLTGRVVVVDPGHNGGNSSDIALINHLVPAGRGRLKPCNTTGTATARGYDEAAFNWSVSLTLRTLLRSEGARVVMTRSSNTGVGPCVNQRAAIGNAVHADAVIAVHADGGPVSGRGFHVIYPPDSGSTAAIYNRSLNLAQAVHDALLRSRVLPTSTYLGQNGYSERDDLAGLNLSRRPAIFVELGNMANATDAALQADPAVRRRLARALAAGLTAFLAPPGR